MDLEVARSTDAYIEDFIIRQQEEGREVVQFQEGPTKTRSGGLSAILFMGRLLFRYKGRRERVLLAIAVHGRVSDICIIWMCSKHANLSWDAIPAFQTFHLSAAKLRAILKTAPLKNHCLLYWGQPVPCLTSSKFQTCSLLFVVSRHQQYTLSLPHKS